MGNKYRMNLAQRRVHKDFNITPAFVTEALLAVEKFEGRILEPACGNGAMAEVLKAHGYDVEASDLEHRGYGVGGKDFLERHERAENIVTNPPYGWDRKNLHLRFAAHAINLAERKVAMFLPLHFLETPKRALFLAASPLKAMYLFTYRVYTIRADFTGEPASMTAYAWFVWDKQHKGEPVMRWLHE
jgi:predicted RNA methylase